MSASKYLDQPRERYQQCLQNDSGEATEKLGLTQKDLTSHSRHNLWEITTFTHTNEFSAEYLSLLH